MDWSEKKTSISFSEVMTLLRLDSSTSFIGALVVWGISQPDARAENLMYFIVVSRFLLLLSSKALLK